MAPGTPARRTWRGRCAVSVIQDLDGNGKLTMASGGLAAIAAWCSVQLRGDPGRARRGEAVRPRPRRLHGRGAGPAQRSRAFLWILLALVLVRLGLRAWVEQHGWLRGSAWSRLDDRLSLAFAVSLDVQWVVGLAFYLGVSVMGARALVSEGLEIVRSPELRFWAIVHPLLGTAALALAHAARIKLRSVTAATARHRVAALSFGAALVLLLLVC